MKDSKEMIFKILLLSLCVSLSFATTRIRRRRSKVLRKDVNLPKDKKLAAMFCEICDHVYHKLNVAGDNSVFAEIIIDDMHSDEIESDDDDDYDGDGRRTIDFLLEEDKVEKQQTSYCK